MVVFDGDTNSAVSTISLPSRPRALAATRDGRHVMVFLADAFLGLIRTDADVPAGTVLLSGGPCASDINPDSEWVYMATVAGPCTGGRCGVAEVVDVSSLRVATTVPIPLPSSSSDLAMIPGGSRVLVVQRDGVYVSPPDTSALQFGAP